MTPIAVNLILMACFLIFISFCMFVISALDLDNLNSWWKMIAYTWIVIIILVLTATAVS